MDPYPCRPDVAFFLIGTAKIQTKNYPPKPPEAVSGDIGEYR